MWHNSSCSWYVRGHIQHNWLALWSKATYTWAVEGLLKGPTVTARCCWDMSSWHSDQSSSSSMPATTAQCHSSTSATFCCSACRWFLTLWQYPHPPTPVPTPLLPVKYVHQDKVLYACLQRTACSVSSVPCIVLCPQTARCLDYTLPQVTVDKSVCRMNNCNVNLISYHRWLISCIIISSAFIQSHN